jgi:dihydroorotase
LLLGQQQYDLLLTRGHVIDPKNGINAVKDVAISNGKIAAVADRIDPFQSIQDRWMYRALCGAGVHRYPAHFWGSAGRGYLS